MTTSTIFKSEKTVAEQADELVSLEAAGELPETRPLTVGGRGRPKRAVPVEGDATSTYAEAVATLQSQVAELQKDLAATRELAGEGIADAGISGFPWQLYRRPLKENDPMSGWIVVAPGGAASTGRYAGRRAVDQYAHYQVKGFLPITAYGPAPVPTTSSGVDSLRPMLAGGGAREFPASQVLAYKWHVRPPIAGLSFPEYEKIRGQELHALCEECDYEEYGMPGDVQVSVNLLRHLRQKHQYPRREAALLIREQGLPAIGRMAIRADQMAGVVTPMDEPDQVAEPAI